jgi:hypothetical protein
MADEGLNSNDEGLNGRDYGLIKMRLHDGAAAAHSRRIDGADHYAENLRYDYLEGKNTVSFAEGTGQRVANESGSGRTRAETNRPAATGAADA